jgi:hypothetical protein
MLLHAFIHHLRNLIGLRRRRPVIVIDRLPPNFLRV